VTKLVLLATTPEESTRSFTMMQFFPKVPSLPFMTWFKPYAWMAIIVGVLLIAFAVVQGTRNPSSIFAVDFTGGAKITYEVTNKDALPPESVRAVAESIGIADAAPQYQKSATGDKNYLEVKTVRDTVNGEEVAPQLTAALQKEYPSAGVVFLDVDAVGTQIGGEMRRSATLAFLLSLLGMLIYLALRFEWSFGIGAVVSLFHVMIMTTGIYLIFGRQISLTVIAAILTAIGYAVNDTIVIFDRIREELRRDQKTSVTDLCNACINKMLSRTVLTSGTTLFVVIALYFFGYGEIRDFALVMALGIVIGTLSSIFVATPTMLLVIRNRRPTFGKK